MNIDELRKLRGEFLRKIEKNYDKYSFTYTEKNLDPKKKLSIYAETNKELAEILMDIKEKILEIASSLRPDKTKGFRGALLKELTEAQMKQHKNLDKTVTDLINYIETGWKELCSSLDNYSRGLCSKIETLKISEIFEEISHILVLMEDVYRRFVITEASIFDSSSDDMTQILKKMEKLKDVNIELFITRHTTLEELDEDFLDKFMIIRERLSKLIYYAETYINPVLYAIDKELHKKMKNIVSDLKTIEKQLYVLNSLYRKIETEKAEGYMFEPYEDTLLKTLIIMEEIAKKIFEYGSTMYDVVKKLAEYSMREEMKNLS
jgi:hypothetical protein